MPRSRCAQTGLPLASHHFAPYGQTRYRTRTHLNQRIQCNWCVYRRVHRVFIVDASRRRRGRPDPDQTVQERLQSKYRLPRRAVSVAPAASDPQLLAAHATVRSLRRVPASFRKRMVVEQPGKRTGCVADLATAPLFAVQRFGRQGQDSLRPTYSYP